MVYDVNGRSVNSPRNLDAELIQYAYNIDGTVVFSNGTEPIPPEPSSPVELVVMSYNVQWFTGANSQLAMLSEIFNTYNADIIGFQEYYKSSDMPTVAANALVDYPYTYKSSLSTNPNGIASKTQPISIENKQYEYADDETWQYQKAKFLFGDKVLTFYNTHLTWRNTEASAEGRRLQMAELFSDAQNEENVIITGDFNSYARDVSHIDYINLFKPFVDAGYNLANASPESGFTGTYCGAKSATSITQMEAPCDNIIVSGNIDLAEVWFDLTKLNYTYGQYTIDHIPVVARLIVH